MGPATRTAALFVAVLLTLRLDPTFRPAARTGTGGPSGLSRS